MCVLPFLIFASSSFALTPSSQQESSDTVAIIYSGNANGRLEPCNCPKTPYGGLSRVASAVQYYKNASPHSFLIECGNMCPPGNDRMLAGYCLQMTALPQYDAVALGNQDLVYGLDFLRPYRDTIHFTPSNISDFPRQNSPLPWLHKQVGSAKIAVINIVSADVFSTLPRDTPIIFADPLTYLKTVIPQARKLSNVIILVSHLKQSDNVKIAQTLPDVDILLKASSSPQYVKPFKINQTLFVDYDSNGQRIGILEIRMKDERIISYSDTPILLDGTFVDHPQAVMILNAYKKDLKARAKSLVQ